MPGIAKICHLSCFFFPHGVTTHIRHAPGILQWLTWSKMQDEDLSVVLPGLSTKLSQLRIAETSSWSVEFAGKICNIRLISLIIVNLLIWCMVYNRVVSSWP